MGDESVPGWCDFFDADEYELFCAAVDDACGMFGAEGQEDFVEGFISLCCAILVVDDVEHFYLDRLARRCHEAGPEEWGDICARQVIAWVETEPQREWLERTPFHEVEPLLQVWLTGEREISFQGEPEDPEQPFSVPLAEGLHLSLAVEVPEFEDNGAPIKTFVTNAAVAAWQRSAADLVASAQGVLRGLEPPTWHIRKVFYTDPAGVRTDVELYIAAQAPDVDSPVSAWAVLLDEVAPEPLPRGAFVAIPERNTLILAMNPPLEDAAVQMLMALYLKAQQDYDRAHYYTQVTRTKFAFSGGGIDGFEALAEFWDDANPEARTDLGLEHDPDESGSEHDPDEPDLKHLP